MSDRVEVGFASDGARGYDQGMQICFLGARGSGKTTVGKMVAAHFGIECVDTDELIQLRAGMTIKTIFESQGESRFRELEASVIEDVIRWTGDRVISLGGGAVLRESNRDLLIRSAAYRYYLRCDPEILMARVSQDPNSTHTRPALTGLSGTVEEIRSLLELREPFYRQVMTREIDVSHLTPAQVKAMIVGEMRSDTFACFSS